MLARIFGSSKSGNSDAQSNSESHESDKKKQQLPPRISYSRPKLLGLSQEEENVANFDNRLIFTSGNNSDMPLKAGYAECMNGGKSDKNEDQATVGNFALTSTPPEGVVSQRDRIDVSYFGIFDGHGGSGAALMAADQLVNHLQEKLRGIMDDLLTFLSDGIESDGKGHYDVTIEVLIRGAIESAFLSFDEQIAKERESFEISGGCTAIVAIYLLDRLFVAHAGDCRAVVYFGEEIVEMSKEFTPETDASRIQLLAASSPSLMAGVFNPNCYHRLLRERDLGSRVLFRPPMASGWHYKTVTKDDLFTPIVLGNGKWARLMGVIGVTRGFGDHSLVVPGTKISVKSFMTPMPEIRVLSLDDRNLTDEDVLVMGCDGLWDFTKNEDMHAVVKKSLSQSKKEDGSISYSSVAKDIVHYARGDNHGQGWTMTDGRDGSFDDICAFAIPLRQLFETHKAKEQKYAKKEVKDAELEDM